jgi:hypothetical protein
MKHTFRQTMKMMAVTNLLLLFSYSNPPLEAGSMIDQYRFERSLICELKEGIREDSFRFSMDGKSVTFVFKDGSNYRVMWNNTPGEAFEEIGDVELSQTGLHIMYWGFRASKVFLLRDHKVISSWPADTKDQLSNYWSLISSNDNHWVASGFTDGSLKWVMIDGTDQPKYKALSPVIFSEKGQSWGYIGLDKENAMIFIVNGKEIRRIRNCSASMLDFSLVNMIISDEGNIIAAIEPTDGGYQVRYRNDVITTLGQSLYVKDGTVLSFIGIQSKEKEEKAPQKISERHIYSKSLVQHSSHVAWVQSVIGEGASSYVHEVIMDGKPIGPKIHAEDNMWLLRVVPQFSSVEDGIAFEGRDENLKWYVWSSKGNSRLYEGAFMPQWSPDGKHLAFVAKVVIDGKTRLLYVVDNKELNAYDNVYSGRFSSDGNVFCFVGEKESKPVLVLNQIESMRFDELVTQTPTIWWPGYVLWYVGKEGRKLYRYELAKAKQ